MLAKKLWRNLRGIGIKIPLKDCKYIVHRFKRGGDTDKRLLRILTRYGFYIEDSCIFSGKELLQDYHYDLTNKRFIREPTKVRHYFKLTTADES